jgi:hypothetical protein
MIVYGQLYMYRHKTIYLVAVEVTFYYYMTII